MNVIDSLFATRQPVFIPFLPAGDPDLATTATLIPAVHAAGGDLVEVGFPFSDPIADGPVIQAAYTRALERGVRVADILACVRGGTGVPMVAMVSYSLIHKRGSATFIAEAQAAGFAGAVVPDLPVEEATELADLARTVDFKLILLVTPTTPPARAAKIAALATGFLYVVSVTGITGARAALPEQLRQQLHELRQLTDLPLCVGFGISQVEHVEQLRGAADGVIVGSALARHLARLPAEPFAQVQTDLCALVRTLSQKWRQP
jgi:tryptophan synthase alpha chain